MKRIKCLQAVLCLILCVHAGAMAQGYPNRAIRVMVGWPPGGGADIVARLVAEGLATHFKQVVNVENRPGASGNLGAEAAARAPADGYTLLVVGGNHVTNQFLYRKIAYDPTKDFEPVTLLTAAPNLLVVHPSLPVKNVVELVALARARPGQLSYGSAGNGTTGHLAMELFKSATKIDMVHVPYKGGSQFVTDMIGGQVVVGFDNILSSGPHVQTGRMRAIGSSGARRSALFADVPTVAESGYPGFEVILWQGLLAPAGTPRDVVDKVNTAIHEGFKNPATQKRFRDLAIEPQPGTPEQFRSFLTRENGVWGKVIKDIGVTLD